jgi:6-phosphofructokinase
VKTLAILTNGGDTCSLNAAIKSVRDNALAAGFTRILGFQDGYLGVTERRINLLTWAAVDAERGGTILRSQRYAPRTEDEKSAFFRALHESEVDVLIVIGGDGTLRAARDLLAWGKANSSNVEILGFPRTIDNDIRTGTLSGDHEVALCPGYPSAATKIARLTRELRTTAMSSSKVFILETMGRDAGWLAAASSLGGAEFILVPEIEMHADDWERLYARIIRLHSIHGHVIIAVSEGLRIDGSQQMDDAFGPRKLGGVGVLIGKKVEQAFAKLGKPVEVRYQQAGYIPRMGSPTSYDIKLAEALGLAIQKMLCDRANGEMPVPDRATEPGQLMDHIIRIPLSKISQYFFPTEDFYDFDRFCVNSSFISFLTTIVDQA